MSDLSTLLLHKYWWVLLIIIAFNILRMFMPKLKGNAGEGLVNFATHLHLDPTVYHLLKDVTLPTQRGTTQIELSPRDVKLLRLFADNPGKVLSRDQLFDAGWGMDYLPSSRSLDQFISQLRKKIERDPSRPRIVVTVHAAGYRYPGEP